MNNYTNGQYSDDILQKYVSGRLSTEEMHALEKDIANDPLLAEALQGYLENAHIDIGPLNNTIKEAILKAHERRQSGYFMMNWKRVAAILIIVGGASAYLLYNRGGTDRPKETVTIQPKKDTIKKGADSHTLPQVAKKEPHALPGKENPAPPILPDTRNKVNNTTNKKTPGLRLTGYTFTGTITDENGKALYEAQVVTAGQLINTVTDRSGSFHFSSLDSVIDVTIQKTGFITRNAQLKAGKSVILTLAKKK